MTLSSKLTYYVFGAILVLILVAKALAMWTDYLWFGAMGQAPVFLTILLNRLGLGLLFGIIFFLWLWLNLRLARRPLPDNVALIGKRLLPDEERAQIELYADKALLVFALIAGLMAGLVASGKWLQWLQFTHATTFGTTDPLFGLDAGFYVFKLSFLRYVLRSLFFAVIVATIASTLVYLYQEAIRIAGNSIQTIPHARAHLYTLVALALVVRAITYRIDQYALLLSNRGGVFWGASYSDVHARLPVMYALMGLCVMGAVVILASIRSRRLFWPAGALAVILLFSFLGGTVFPVAIQKLVVLPTQLQKEEPFIKYNIDATNRAFGLDRIHTEVHPVGKTLTWDDVQKNRNTIDNIRLWDHRPLEKTLDQRQGLRPYYDFPDVDVDRYTVNGKCRQVMIAPRQVNSAGIQGSQTWVKTHLQYTHGYGVCVVPVSEIGRGDSGEGLPNYWVKDIPPLCIPELQIKRPGIYYYASIHPRLIEIIQTIERHERAGQPDQAAQNPGQAGPGGQQPDPPDRPGAAAQRVMDEPLAKIEDYVIVNTSVAELDYPRGDESDAGNAYTKYAGKGGVPVGSFWRRIAFFARFQDWQLLLTQSITKDSRIIMNRTLPERIQALCPFFLMCDPDPYITIINGELKWINDVYTYSRLYPYSTPHKEVGVNYLRNSIKVVCDAYDGIPEFYVVDESDPMVKCYRSIFPSLFKSEPMPSQVRAHIRYPQLLFLVQAQMYGDYHMLDPTTFYQREDSWAIAQELYGSEPRQTEPYYVVMSLPGEQREEFLLVVPMTPRGREDKNMVAWLAARCDGENYGKLLCYTMPKSLLVDGPMQIESRIGQNPEFSKNQTLWGQRGSTIIRGNLLVIPFEHTLLYAEPVYIAAANSPIPELKLVVLVNGNRVAFGPDLESALENLLGQPPEKEKPPAEPKASATSATQPSAGQPQPQAATIRQLVDRALQLQTQKQQALTGGDLGAFQKLDQEQAQILQQIQQLAQ